MRIAIVGSGISGLVCAWLLHTEHEVTLFEAERRIGGHTHTVHVDSGGRSVAVDTGFIVFNTLNYPNFVKLLDRLGVASQPTSMSFSVRDDEEDLEYNGSSLNGLFCQRRNLVRPRFWRMIRDLLRFNREALAVLDADDERMTLGEYVERQRYSRMFIDHYLVPMGAAIWSSPPGRFREFPIRFVVDFFNNHKLLSVSGRPVWRVVVGGSARYVEAMTASFRDRLRPGCRVRQVRRGASGVEVTADGCGTTTFDQVILACHSDEALAALADPSETERELLQAFPYQVNDVLLHTDVSVLPRRRRAWAAWNYRIVPGESERVTLNYNMNILQRLETPDVFVVTLNDRRSVQPSSVRGEFTYSHPVYVAGRTAAQRRHAELIRVNRTSFCGAYWGYGFHEDGVKSALAVCRAFGQEL